MASVPRSRRLRVGLTGDSHRRRGACGWVFALVVLLCAPAQAQPASPTPIVHSGWFHVIWGDAFARPGTATVRHVLVDDQGRWHHLRLDARTLDGLGGTHGLHQRRVRVTGHALAAPAAPAQSGPPATIDVQTIQPERAEVRATAALAVGGAQPWLTILCRFADSPTVTPRPKSYFAGLMSGAEPGLDHYWREVSYDRVDLTGSAVVGWYDLPFARSHYVYAPSGSGVHRVDFQPSAEDCTAAAAADATLTDFVGVNLMFNDVLDCCSWGGGVTLTQGGQTRPYRATWLPPWAYANQFIVAHEMGHGFGLPHSSGPYANTYDSDWDPMSGGGACAQPDATYGCVAVHTIAYHKDLLGWITGASTFAPTPGQSETITLERLAKPGSGDGHLMARIPVPGSTTRFYTVEARRTAGYDREIPGEAVLINDVDTTRNDRQAQVVDPDGNGNPNDAGAMWLPGEIFTDVANQISVVVDGATASGFQVTIVTGGFRLAVVRAGSGTGRVKGAAAGIHCGATCTGVYEGGTVVTLKAVPDLGDLFAGWSGCDATAGKICTVGIGTNRSVTAAFIRQPRLSITVSGPGTVTSVPDGIDCGTTCTASYAAGTSVTLRAVPAPQSVFAGWSGDPDCADGIVSMADDVTCGARFQPVPDLAITAVSAPSATVRPGGRVVVTDTVVNQGLGAAGPSAVRYYLSSDARLGGPDRLLLGRRLVPALPPAAASTGTVAVWIPFTVAPGTYYVLACADDTHTVSESNESQNCLATTTPFPISWQLK